MYPMESPTTSGYDRVSTMFSPKGRLYQVEYASKIVEQGTLGLGMIFNEGVLLTADKNVTTKLLLPHSIEKLFKIDDHVGAISSGLVGDARRLVKFARERAIENKVLYGENIETEVLAKEIAAVKHLYTQYGGMRPFGVSFIIGGIDRNSPHVFETEPSGALAEYRAVAIGKGRKKAEAILEEKHDPKMDLASALKLALEAIKSSKGEDEKFDLNYIDFATITKKNYFSLIEPRDLKKLLSGKKE